MAGRKPKPTAMKVLEGNPGKRKLIKKEPVPAKGMPVCPEWLMPEAKVEWQRLAELMNQMGVLTEVDMAAFAAYCQSYARWLKQLRNIHSEFIDVLNDYLHWYNEKRIKQSLGYLSPMEYIHSLGLTAQASKKMSAPSFRVKAKVCTGPTFYRWIFGSGGKIKIEEPEEVRDH